jgi:hypothetical protein
VLFPPCIRQRPLGIAGACKACRSAWNALRIEAPLAHGVHLSFLRPPPGVPASPPTTLAPDLCRNNRLTTVSNMHMLDRNNLTAAGTSTLQGKEAGLIGDR